MARAYRIETESGPAFRWGTDGEPIGYDEFDAESTVAALVKAVNVGVLAGDDIEGELEQDIAALIKASGDAAWDAEGGFSDLYDDLNDCLPDSPLADESSPYVIRDVALDCSRLLACYYPGNGEDSQTFIIPFTLDDQNEPTLGSKDQWLEVEQATSYVEKHRLGSIRKDGKLVWAADASYNSLQQEVSEALPAADGPNASIYVQDIALDGSQALVCEWNSRVGGGSQMWIVGINSDGDDVTMMPRATWTAVEQETTYVEKAGKVLSAKNAKLITDAADALKTALSNAGVLADEPATKATGPFESEGTYIVAKSRDEDRYTMGPYYVPNRVDAHGEMIDPEVLEKAVWEYVRSSAAEGRRINDQHDDTGDATTGEWVGVISWPKEETWELMQADGTTKSVTLPAGTVYMGIVWDEPEWKLIKSGAKTGLSMGGRAMRVEYTGDALDHMGWKHAAKTPMHEYDGGKDGSGPCTSCGKSESAGNHG
jgi:hypothetical protein